jgi:hypothetical protein
LRQPFTAHPDYDERDELVDVVVRDGMLLASPSWRHAGRRPCVAAICGGHRDGSSRLASVALLRPAAVRRIVETLAASGWRIVVHGQRRHVAFAAAAPNAASWKRCGRRTPTSSCPGTAAQAPSASPAPLALLWSTTPSSSGGRTGGRGQYEMTT